MTVAMAQHRVRMEAAWRCEARAVPMAALCQRLRVQFCLVEAVAVDRVIQPVKHQQLRAARSPPPFLASNKYVINKFTRP